MKTKQSLKIGSKEIVGKQTGKKPSSKKINGKKGQAIVEAVLIMVIFLGISYFVAGKLKEHEAINQFIAGPWKTIAGMMESGVWEGRDDAKEEQHPNHFDRMYSEEGKTP